MTDAAPAAPLPTWLKVLPPAARFILHGAANARAAAAAVWGVQFATEACRARIHGTRATLWLAPDEYLLLDLAPGNSAAAALEGAMQGLGHALVEVSERQLAFEVSGPHAALILNGGCPLDLDLVEFPVGMCTRTLFAKADIVLWRTREDAFHVEVWRSFGDYLVAALGEVGAEF